jgi:hypothetical protein
MSALARARVATNMAACAYLIACQGPKTATEVIVVVDAEKQTRTRTDSLRVTVESRAPGATASGNRFHKLPFKPYWPVRLALVPDGGDAGREYLVIAEALNVHGIAFARATLLSNFVDGELRYAHLLFEDSCNDVTCQSTETCNNGQCVGTVLVSSRGFATTAIGRVGSAGEISHGGGGSGGAGAGVDAGGVGGSPKGGTSGSPGGGAGRAMAGSGGTPARTGGSGAAGGTNASCVADKATSCGTHTCGNVLSNCNTQISCGTCSSTSHCCGDSCVPAGQLCQ